MPDLSSYCQAWDVVIIGGGATGAGILRDLALRGVSALLLEQKDLAHGTSSRFHGLLHSGARYAVKDAEAASECIAENKILRQIAQYCIEDTLGLFVRPKQDPKDYEETWLKACATCGIEVKGLTLTELGQREPALSTNMASAYQIPDAAIDGFRLIWQNVRSAQQFGAKFRTYTKVMRILNSNGKVTGVEVLDTKTCATAIIPCKFVVNAAGSFVAEIAKQAGLEIHVQPDRGALVTFNHRFTNSIVNRLRQSGDGDIFVPHGSVTILGTTSTPTTDPDDTHATTEEALYLLQLGKELFPRLDNYRILRIFAGTRPLYIPPDAAGSGRTLSRNFVILDHEREGLEGMASICGGKLTTYRLMAERMTDLVCSKLGISKPCCTDSTPLLVIPPHILKKATRLLPTQALQSTIARLASSLKPTLQRLENSPWKRSLLCECELVTFAEFEQVASEDSSHSLNDVRRRTRMGMGTCQGSFCGLRGVGEVMQNKFFVGQNDPKALLRSFQQERWHGIRPVLWGNELREAELARSIYGATLNLDGADSEI